jgi:hypothetical protein
VNFSELMVRLVRLVRRIASIEHEFPRTGGDRMKLLPGIQLSQERTCDMRARIHEI